MSSDKWVFSPKKYAVLWLARQTDLQALESLPAGDFFWLISQFTVDGPVEFNKTDPDGWTALTWQQLTELTKQCIATLGEWRDTIAAGLDNTDDLKKG